MLRDRGPWTASATWPARRPSISSGSWSPGGPAAPGCSISPTPPRWSETSPRCRRRSSPMLWIGILTFTTYALAGHMREQVCLYMCPWPRIQAALTDEYALNVTYRYDRGEPRGSVKKNERVARARPAGRRLRRLPAMRPCLPDRRRYPRRRQPRLHPVRALHRRLRRRDERRSAARPRLIAYDTDINIKRRQAGKAAGLPHRARPHRALCRHHRAGRRHHDLRAGDARPRRAISVIHDRNPMFVRLSDGALRNAYTIRIVNKRSERARVLARRDRLAGSPSSTSSACRRAPTAAW